MCRRVERQADFNFSQTLSEQSKIDQEKVYSYVRAWRIAVEKHSWYMELGGRNGKIYWPDKNPIKLDDLFDVSRIEEVTAEAQMHYVAYCFKYPYFIQRAVAHGVIQNKVKEFVIQNIWPSVAWMAKVR